jgi:hypothetical protein
VRLVLPGLLTGLVAGPLAAAEPPSAADCDAYYRFELRVIDEQRYYLTEAAIAAVVDAKPSPEERPRLIEAAKEAVRERMAFDEGAAKRGLERCLQRAQ